jgi:hypothetical protein
MPIFADDQRVAPLEPHRSMTGNRFSHPIRVVFWRVAPETPVKAGRTVRTTGPTSLSRL